MADYLIKGETLTDIAEAIRAKTGKKEEIPVPDMASQIEGITGGGVGTQPAVIRPLEITKNGTYNANEGVDGYAPVTVNVAGGPPVIEPLEITESGTYTAPEGVDGYSPVTVNIAGGDSSGGGTIPAGLYLSRLNIGVHKSNYYQQWFYYQGYYWFVGLESTGPGNQYYFWKYIDGVWTNILGPVTISIGSPTTCRIVEYQGKMHFLGGTTKLHYVFDGTTVTTLNQTTSDVYSKGVVVCNDELYYLADGSPYGIYKWDPTSDSWSTVLGFSGYSSRMLMSANGKLYYTEYQDLYLVENGAATKIATLSNNFYIGANVGPWSVGDCIYFISTDHWKEVCKLSKYDTEKNTETVVGFMPKPKSGYIHIMKGQVIYLYGDNSGYTPFILHEVSE